MCDVRMEVEACGQSSYGVERAWHDSATDRFVGSYGYLVM